MVLKCIESRGSKNKINRDLYVYNVKAQNEKWSSDWLKSLFNAPLNPSKMQQAKRWSK